jgi:hypothetical protein
MCFDYGRFNITIEESLELSKGLKVYYCEETKKYVFTKRE